MIKKKALIAVLITLLLGTCMVFASCGGFDAGAYVKESLDYVKTGNITDEYLKMTGMSMEEAQKEYDDSVEKLVNEMIDVVGIDSYNTEDNKQTVRDFAKTMLASLRYDISEEVEEKDGSYFVEVNVYPVKAMLEMDSYLHDEFTPEWEKKISSGSYKFTTKDQLMIDMMNDYMVRFTDKIKNSEYGEPQTIKLEVKFDKNEDMYKVTDDSIDKLLNTAFGETFGE